MKKALAFSMLFGAGFLVAVVLLEHAPTARSGSGGAVATRNGDVNGDGGLDISDVIYSLFYIFLDGPPPAAFGDSPELLERVATLEANSAQLSGTITGMQNNIEELQNITNIISGDNVIFLSNADASSFFADGIVLCNDGFHTYTQFMHYSPSSSSNVDEIIVENCEISEEEILFETKTPGHLIIRTIGIVGYDNLFKNFSIINVLIDGIIVDSIQGCYMGDEEIFFDYKIPVGRHSFKLGICYFVEAEPSYSYFGFNDITIIGQLIRANPQLK